ncbi:hypothetical protein Sjap_009357 [Stephania japonica]|uniref:Beta-Casp domain-containing protein n=1 Tax=Stephania japonica TaxID=461633 RepID=A0AAP0JR65_9MAGN
MGSTRSGPMNFYMVSEQNNLGLVFEDLIGLAIESRPVCEPKAYKSIFKYASPTQHNVRQDINNLVSVSSVSSLKIEDSEVICLSKGGGFNCPPCHILEIDGFRILVDCPLDLSALAVFYPFQTNLYEIPNCKSSNSQTEQRLVSCERDRKRRRIEEPVEVDDLILAEPWYKTVANLHLWDLSSIDVVLITSFMGMMGLPFLTNNVRFSAKIYVTEATAQLGKLMMEDLVSMHMNVKQNYGPADSGLPQWMKWEALESLHLEVRNIVMGNDGAQLGGWQPLYSAANVKECMHKVQTLKYAEEACYNGALVIMAFSSGLDIGTCNWTISSSKSRIAYLSSSIFYSLHAMSFDYDSIRANDVVLFSDFSSMMVTDSNGGSCSSQSAMTIDTMDPCDENFSKATTDALADANESSDEMDKLAFICSYAVDSVGNGGSVLIPYGRVGIMLQLLELMFALLESSSLEVPVFIISSVAEEMLDFTNVVPEWLCKERQEKLYSGEALFGHTEQIKAKKLHLFPAIHSADLVKMWQEPCIVFTPHWSLRLGPVVHLLQRWCGDPNSLLVLEHGTDAELALLPFKPMAMKVLQCSFLSGIMMQKLQPLLDFLQPNVVLVAGQARIESWRTYIEILPESLDSSQSHMKLHWGSIDPNLLEKALQKKGIDGSRITNSGVNDGIHVFHIANPSSALIEIHAMYSIISSADETLSSLLVEAVSSVLEGI